MCTFSTNQYQMSAQHFTDFTTACQWTKLFLSDFGEWVVCTEAVALTSGHITDPAEQQRDPAHFSSPLHGTVISGRCGEKIGETKTLPPLFWHNRCAESMQLCSSAVRELESVVL